MKNREQRPAREPDPKPLVTRAGIFGSRWGIAIVIFYLSLACVLRTSGDTRNGNGYLFTSIVRLLANPSQYQGKQVEVIGYYVTGQELCAIFLNSEDARSGNVQNGLWIDLRGSETNKLVDRKLKAGHVRIDGTFYYTADEGAGHMGQWPAALTNVTFLQSTK